MKLHYSQTDPVNDDELLNVLLSYEITLLSNVNPCVVGRNEFYYPMKLHYSQTYENNSERGDVFYYPMKLHYSQT